MPPPGWIDDIRVSRRAALCGALALAAGASPAFASLYVLPRQRRWHVCNRCRLLYFAGFPPDGRDAWGQPTHGRCAAGAGHIGEYAGAALPYNGRADGTPLTFNAHEDAGHQGNWRYCHKCRVFFFDGLPEKGVCAAGGGHEAAGLFFLATHNDRNPQHPKYRFCGKCYAMFYIGFINHVGMSDRDNRCPAGGAHRAEGFLFNL